MNVLIAFVRGGGRVFRPADESQARGNAQSMRYSAPETLSGVRGESTPILLGSLRG